MKLSPAVISLSMLLVLATPVPSASSQAVRLTLAQHQACYYQPFHKHLACQCGQEGSHLSYLGIKMEYWVREMGQEVRSVKIHSCRDLLIGLDLTGINPSTVPFTFIHSTRVTVDFITFDKSFAGNQKLVTQFHNIESVSFQGLHVDEAIEIGIENVKYFLLESSTFSHLPPNSVTIERTSKVIIKDCIFLRLSSGSVKIKKTKKVEVINNELSINAIKAISASEGSHLFISCNRLLGDPIAPECLPTTTTTTTTTMMATIETTFLTSSSALLSRLDSNEEKDDSSDSVAVETLVGVVTGALVVLTILIIVIVVLVWRRNQFIPSHRSEDYILHSEDPIHPPCIPLPPPMPTAPLYDPTKHKTIPGGQTSALKIAHPVWLDEIQNNPIFNRQRHKLTEEGLPLRSISGIIEQMEGEEATGVVGEEGEVNVRESSKTESDQEEDTGLR